MDVVKSILTVGWKAIVGNSFEKLGDERDVRLFPVSFIKESPGSLRQTIRPIWGRNVKALKDGGIPEEGVPCHVGLGLERALLKPDTIVYPERPAKKSQEKRWKPA